MKKLLFFIRDQHGFLLPYVLFMTALAFIVITVSIQMYRNEIEITDNQIEQLRVETLFQMGREQFIDDWENGRIEANPVVYSFPYGETKIHYMQLEDSLYQLHAVISTADGFSYVIRHPVNLY